MTDHHRPRSGRLAWACAGAVAAVSGLAAADVAAALFVPRAAPLSAVSDLVISLAPPGLTAWAIATFGTADKPLLQAGVIAAVAAAGAGAGLAWRLRAPAGALALAALAAVGAAAAATRPGLGPAAAVPSLLAAAWAGAALAWWGARHDRVGAAGRRRLLIAAGAVAAAGLAAGALARRSGPGSVEADRAAVELPEPDDPAVEPAPRPELGVAGLAPYWTANRDFYRIDTAITVPAVDVDTWRLRVRGRVGAERVYSFDDLLGRELIERDITVCCVSNPIGGDLVGNARWLGVSLADLLAESDPDPAADQLVSRSADGWTAGTPTRAVFDGRDAMVAVGMNGRPLPAEHGWPARLVVPGLYGYTSATKWLVDLELTTFDAFDAYWIARGWGLPGPVKTASRIDTPRRSAAPGTVAVAGVAWAQHRGIDAVHLKVDDGEWTECELSDVATDDTWRQWHTRWRAEPGRHTLTVRATDGEGRPQTERTAPVKPDGATGLHSVTIDVE